MLIKDKYIKINIREYLALGADDDAGEPALDRLLSEFSCPKNPDVEHFLKNNCVEFTKKNQSVTYLVMSMEKGELLGYFTIALKPLTVRDEMISNTVKRKIKRVSEFDSQTNSYTMSAYLIAQLGKITQMAGIRKLQVRSFLNWHGVLLRICSIGEVGW